VAGDIPNLNVEILVQLSNLTAAVTEATSGLNKIGDKAVEVGERSSSSFHKLKDVMLGVFGGNLLTSGVMGLEKTLSEMNLAVQDAQVESERLATALKNTGNATEANTQLVENNVKSYADLGFTHAQASQAMGTLITATKSVSESTQLMAMAADLARYKHEDLNTAATTLARGTQGSVKAFKELGITLDTTLPKNQAIAKAFDELNGKISGQAVAYTKSFAGELAVLKEKFNEVAVEIGNVVLPAVSKIIEAFSKFTNIIKPFGGDLLILTGIITGAVAAYKAYEAVVKGIAIVQEGYMVTLALVKGAKLADVVATDAQTASQKALAFVIKQNPYMKIVEVVTILVGVMYELWKHNDAVRNIMITVAEAGVKGFGYIVGGVGYFIRALEYVVAGPLLLLLKGLSLIGVSGAKDALNTMTTAIKDTGHWFDDTAKKIYAASNELDKYRKASSGTSMPEQQGPATGFTGITGNVPGGDTVAGAAAAAKKRAAEIKKANEELLKLDKEYSDALIKRQDEMDAALKTRRDAEAKDLLRFNETKDDLNRRHQEAYASAQHKFDEAQTAAEQNYKDSILQIDTDFANKQADLLTAHNDKIATIQKQYADNAKQIEQNAADQRQSIIEQSIALMTNAFENATKVDIGSLFKVGDTAGDLVGKLQDQLDAVLKLQQNAGRLAAQGYSQSFIDQIIAKGPDTGNKLAQTVLDATPETAARIKGLYGQIESVSQNGLNGLAQQMNSGGKLATQKLMDQYAQVGVNLTKLLAENTAKMNEAITKENDAYLKALDAATDAHDKATAAAQKALDDAMIKAHQTQVDAQAQADQTLKDGMDTAQRALDDANAASMNAYQDQVSQISKTMDAALGKLQIKIAETMAMLNALKNQSSAAGVGGGFGNQGGGYGAGYNQFYQGAGDAVPPGALIGGNSPVVGSITNNVYTNDASLPSITQGTLNAITLGQTQGLISNKPGQAVAR
jgi:hypothetical protein